MLEKPDGMVVTVAAVSAAVIIAIILLSALPWIAEAFAMSAAVRRNGMVMEVRQERVCPSVLFGYRAAANWHDYGATPADEEQMP